MLNTLHISATPTYTTVLTPGVHAEAEVSNEPSALRVGEKNG